MGWFMMRERSSNAAPIHQAHHEPAPEARVEVPKARPEGAMCKVIALIFEGMKRLIFGLPARASPLHQFVDIAGADPQVSDPTEVLHLPWGDLPILDEVDPHVRTRGIEGHGVDKAKPVHDARGAVVPLIIRDR